MVDVFQTSRGGYRAAKGWRKSSQDKFLSRDEVASLLRAAASDRRKYGINAYDLIALAVNFGLRCSEALDLKQEDFKTLPMGYFRVRTLKRRAFVEDRLYTGREGAKFVAEIVERRRQMTKDSVLFPFGARTARYLFAFYADKAGISPNVSFHALRHTAARMLLDSLEGTKYAAKAMNIVQTFLRHRPTSTQIYTEPTADVMMAVMDLKGIIR